MPVASDVIGVLDELRATEGSIRRARIIGRLWNLARTLPAGERRELAQVLAERYAPQVAERLSEGSDVQSSELLEMVRAVGRVDADEIGDIMDQLQTSGGRRELFVEVVDSLRDDLAEADIETLIDNPDARAAALAAAGHQLAADMELVEAVVDPEAQADLETFAAEPDEQERPHEGALTASHDAELTEPSPAVDIEPGPEATGAAIGAAAAAAIGQDERDPGLDESPTHRVWSPVWDSEEIATTDASTVTSTEPDVLMEAAETDTWDMAQPRIEIDAKMLGTVRSPIHRLRLLRESISRLDGATGADLTQAFPDGWQRRRAAAVVVAALPPGDVAAACRVVNTLEATSDRRWIVRSLLAEWQLDEPAAVRLTTSTSVPRTVMRLAQRDQQPQWGP